ncbi:hypothetical protein PYCCODRAFT_1468192 [Trametes coccinea BRFM310]|uniref:Uncharacterized protein n=1 Tax=Trametes coccinea (strain BRFM310) TaxID=1353009 RepID=A0A1Y2IPK2_TRAC3|nr:hypothetical protein PYCCODRAFT_1468192 [Trametes coccinea BRFM310]
MSAHIAHFQLTREQAVPQVDGLIEEFSKYFQITAEDAEIPSYDPTVCDALTAKLYQSPAIKPSFMPSEVVGPTPSLGEVDRYLEHATRSPWYDKLHHSIGRTDVDSTIAILSV